MKATVRTAVAVFVLSSFSLSVTGQDGLVRIRETANLAVRPDTLHLLMRVESHEASLSAAASTNQEQIKRFIAALTERGIPEDTIRISNYLVERTVENPGINFSQNLIISLPNIRAKTPDELNRLIAVVQDAGARYGSACITCIGSG